MKRTRYLFSVLVIILTGAFLIVSVFEINRYRNAQQIRLSKSQAKYRQFRVSSDYNKNTTNTSFSKEIESVLREKSYKGNAYIVENNQVVFNNDNGTNKKRYLNLALDELLTSSLIMHYSENGKLDLNTKVSKFYPTIQNASKITIRDLINMTSGILIPSKVDYFSGMNEKDVINETVKRVKITKKMVGKQVINASNYVLLAGIIRDVSKGSFANAMSKAYLKPYELTHSGVLTKKRNLKRVVSGHTGSNRGVIRPSVSSVTPLLGSQQYAYSSGDMYFLLKNLFQGNIIRKSSLYNVLNSDNSVLYNGGLTRYQQNSYLVNTVAFGTRTMMIISESGNQCVILQINSNSAKVDLNSIGTEIYSKLESNLNKFPNF